METKEKGITEGSVANYSCEQGTGYLGGTRGLAIRIHSGRELSHAVRMVSSNTIQCSLSIYRSYSDEYLFHDSLKYQYLLRLCAALLL